MNRQVAQAWWLRLTGLVEVLAFIAVVMPRSWMEISHRWLNMGQMPDGPLIMFMIRQASYTYGMHGVFMWILASDVERFRPLITFSAISYVLAAFVFFLIDQSAGMPIWWTVGDALGCLVVGVVMLLLNFRVRS